MIKATAPPMMEIVIIAGLGKADSAFSMAIAVLLLPSGGIDCVAGAGPVPEAIEEDIVRSQCEVEVN